MNIYHFELSFIYRVKTLLTYNTVSDIVEFRKVLKNIFDELMSDTPDIEKIKLLLMEMKNEIYPYITNRYIQSEWQDIRYSIITKVPELDFMNIPYFCGGDYYYD